MSQEFEESFEEQAYRRGYSQGVYAGYNKMCTPELAMEWRHSGTNTLAPGLETCVVDKPKYEDYKKENCKL